MTPSGPGAWTTSAQCGFSMSGTTIRNHLWSFFLKLQVNDRAEAIKRAQAAGLGG